MVLGVFTRAPKIARGIASISDTKSILTNFVNKGSTLSARKEAFSQLGITQKRPRFDADMQKILHEIYYPDEKVPTNIRGKISEWKGKPKQGRSASKLEDWKESEVYGTPEYIKKQSIGVKKTKRENCN